MLSVSGNDKVVILVVERITDAVADADPGVHGQVVDRVAIGDWMASTACCLHGNHIDWCTSLAARVDMLLANTPGHGPIGCVGRCEAIY